MHHSFKNVFKTNLILLKLNYGGCWGQEISNALPLWTHPWNQAYSTTTQTAVEFCVVTILSTVTPRPQRKEKTVDNRHHKPEAYWEKRNTENSVSHRFYLVQRAHHQQNWVHQSQLSLNPPTQYSRIKTIDAV